MVDNNRMDDTDWSRDGVPGCLSVVVTAVAAAVAAVAGLVWLVVL